MANKPDIPAAHINNGRDRGRACEDRVFYAIVSRYRLWPSFVVRVRRATAHEDAHGADIIVVIRGADSNKDVSMPIQVKSSKGEVTKFRRLHADIPVILGTRPEVDIFLWFIGVCRVGFNKEQMASAGK